MNLIPKGKRLYSMVYLKCPQCHEGNLFEDKAYGKHFMKMPKTCPQCGLRYEQEPYFFSGAMYVSYALQVALFTTVYVALRVLFNPSMETYMLATILAALALFPITLRLSRSIYINFFVGFKKTNETQLEGVKVETHRHTPRY